MATLADISTQIRPRRQERGYSQTDLATRAGVSRIAVDRLENGRLADVRYRTLIKILHALGLDLRVTELNASRPTLDDLRAEDEP